MVDRSASSSGTQRMQGRPPPPPPSGPGGDGTPGHITDAAEALGLSTDEVLEALTDGASLADLAEEQGMSRDELVEAMVASAPEDLQCLGNVEELVGQLVDQQGVGRPTGPPPPRSTGVFGAGMTEGQQSTLDGRQAGTARAPRSW